MKATLEDHSGIENVAMFREFVHYRAENNGRLVTGQDDRPNQF